MGLELQARNLIQDELPVALETAGMEWHAASVRTVSAHAYAEAAELLETALLEARDILDPDQFRFVEEFLFWAQAALIFAIEGNEADFLISFRKFQNAVHLWWSTLIVH